MGSRHGPSRMGSTAGWLIAMGDEAIIIQHRFSDQLMCVSLSQYRAESKHRYRDWQLRGTAAFIAPPPLACLPVQGPPLPPANHADRDANHPDRDGDADGADGAPQAIDALHADVDGDVDVDADGEDLAEYVDYDADANLTLGNHCYIGSGIAGEGDEYGYDHEHVY